MQSALNDDVDDDDDDDDKIELHTNCLKRSRANQMCACNFNQQANCQGR